MLISTCTEIFFLSQPTGRKNSRAISSTFLLGIMTQEMNKYLYGRCLYEIFSFIFFLGLGGVFFVFVFVLL